MKSCLNSVLKQTYENIEIILVNDGSNDGSDKICYDYASKDKRIIVLNQQNNSVSSARNTGIEYQKVNIYCLLMLMIKFFLNM